MIKGELPEGVAVYVAWQDPVFDVVRSRKIKTMYFLNNVISKITHDVKIYPTNAKTKYTKILTSTILKEGMTPAEFQEYIDG
jgi:hypothetical protein